MERMYNIVQINDRTGSRIMMTVYPMNHKDCCTVLSKMVQWPKHFQIRNVLEEIK